MITKVLVMTSKTAIRPFCWLAGAQGIEPWSAVLETAVLPLNDAPILIKSAARLILSKCPKPVEGLTLPGYSGFFMRSAFLAPLTEFFELQLSFHFFLVLGGVIVGLFANCTL